MPAFIDSVLADVYPKDAQDRFVTGLGEFATAAAAGRQTRSSNKTPTQRAAFVKHSLEMALAR